MPSFDIVKQSKVNKTFRVASVMSQFDLQSENINERFVGNIDIEDKQWNVGVIYGASGTGKSTIAKQLFPEHYFKGYEYSNNSVLDDFPKETNIKDITNIFNKVGFSSPPSWLKPYSVLSNGEKMRVDLARALIEEKEVIVFDEFTSVVDREIAKLGSYVVQKVVRKENKKFIAVSCHNDILEWLEPDWVFNTDTMNFFFYKDKPKRPQINLQISKCDRSYWKYFSKYHYLDHDLSKSAQCYLATIYNKPVAFCGVLHFPHPSATNIKRVTRIVVAPDYQGYGIGNKLLNFLGDIYLKQKFRFTIVTSNIALCKSFEKDPKWRLKSYGRKLGVQTMKSLNLSTSKKRVTMTWEYYN